MKYNKNVLIITGVLIVLFILPIIYFKNNALSHALDEIRSRDTIKKQQELIVEETYYLEEKTRVENAKEIELRKFDIELDNIEKKIEDIRKEKLSF